MRSKSVRSTLLWPLYQFLTPDSSYPICVTLLNSFNCGLQFGSVKQINPFSSICCLAVLLHHGNRNSKTPWYQEWGIAVADLTMLFSG